MNKLEGISRDPKTGQPIVLNPNDRKLVAKQFEKHVIQIFEQLGKAVSDKQFEGFMETL